MSEAVKLVAYSSSSSDEQISAPPVAVVKPQIHPTQTETAQTGQPTDEAPESAQASEETTEDVELPRVDIDEPTPEPDVVLISSDSETVSFHTDTTLG